MQSLIPHMLLVGIHEIFVVHRARHGVFWLHTGVEDSDFDPLLISSFFPLLLTQLHLVCDHLDPNEPRF